MGESIKQYYIACIYLFIYLIMEQIESFIIEENSAIVNMNNMTIS